MKLVILVLFLQFCQFQAVDLEIDGQRTVIDAAVNVTVNDSITCGNSHRNCMIRCNDGRSCSNVDIDGSGITIHCPTREDCGVCIVKCVGQESCLNSTIYSYNCNTILTVKGIRSFKNAKIYGPTNNADSTLWIKVGHNEIAKQYFYNSSIYATNTTNVRINVTSDNTSVTELFDHNSIYAQNSNNLQITCSLHATCANLTVYCPENGINCIFSADEGVNAGDNKFYAIEGVPNVCSIIYHISM